MTASNRPVAYLADPVNLVPLLYLLVWGTVAVAFRPAGDFGVETDFYGDFAHYSRMWLEDGPTLMNGFRGPFYYLLLGVFGKLFGDPFLTAKILSVLGASVGLALLGRLVRNLWGDAQALVAMVFVASNPIFAEYSYRACSDPVFWALLVAVVFLVHRGGAHPLRDWTMAGALAGLAYLTRYNGVALVPAALLAGLILFRPGRTAWLRFGVFAVAWWVVVGPWAFYCWQQTGDPLWNNNFSNVAVNVYVEHPGTAASGNFMGDVRFTSLGEVLRVDPGAFARALFRNAGRNLWYDLRDLLTLPWAVVGLLGLVLGARSWLTRRRLAFAVMALLIYIVLLPAFYNPRFMIGLLVWWGAAAGGVVQLARFLPQQSTSKAPRNKGKKKSAGPRRVVQPIHALVGILVLGAAVGVARNVRASQDPLRHGGLAIEIRALAKQVRGAGVPVGRLTPIAASKPHVGYYLDAPVVPVAQGGLEDLRASGAHYLLISGIEVMRYPGLNPLWVPRDPSQIPQGLALAGMATLQTRAGRRAATLYAIQDPLPYTPPGPPRPIARAQDPAPGFTRLDDLRRRMAEWYVSWNSNLGDVDGLLDRMDDSVQNSYATLILRGDAALETNDPQGAIRWFTQAMEVAPDSLTLRLRRSTAYSLAGDTAAADEELLRFLADHRITPPTTSDEWYQLGAGLLYRRAYSQTFPFMLRASSADAPTAQAMRGIAYCWAGLGNTDRAKEILRAHLAGNPGDTEATGLLRTLEQGL